LVGQDVIAIGSDNYHIAEGFGCQSTREQDELPAGFVAILEVCGFNDWLLELLDEYGCQQTVLVQPEKRSKQKTATRKRLGQVRTRTLNKIQHIVLRHNLHQECPTKGLQTKAARKWPAHFSLGPLFPGQGRPTGNETSSRPVGSVGRATGRNGRGDSVLPHRRVWPTTGA